MMVDGDVEVFLAHVPAVALPGAVARDPVANPADSPTAMQASLDTLSRLHTNL
jgi:hypothetical protein